MNPSISISLSERMAALKAKHDTNHRSECTNPTDISVLLELYNKAPHECYIDYMEGFKLLLDWLCPVPEQLHITFYKRKVNVPRLACGYDSYEVAKLLTLRKLGSMSHPEYLDSLSEILSVIFIYNAKSVPRDYLS